MFIFFLLSLLFFGVRTTQVSAAVLGNELHIKKKRRKKLAIVTVPKCLSRSPREQMCQSTLRITRDLKSLRRFMNPRRRIVCFAEFYGQSFCVFTLLF